MKKLLFSFVALFFATMSYAQDNPGIGDTTALGIFFDSFDKSSVDLNKWSIGNQKWGVENGGIVPENVSMANGNLVIEAHGNNYTGPVQGFGQNTKVGGGLISKPKFGAGVYEVRAKICPRLGALSAFWTFEYGADGQKGYSEIDFEMPAFKPPGNPSFEYLFCNNWETETKYESVAAKVSPLNDGQYHVFRFEWYPASMTSTPHVDYYLDGKFLTYSTNHVPNFDAQYWIAIWFPTWAGTPDFEVDHMYVDWFKFTPKTTDPGLPGTIGAFKILYANFNESSNYAYAGGDAEEGGTSTSASSFVNATETGKILKWNYGLAPNSLGYSYAYCVVNKDALESENGVNTLGTRYLKFWVKPEGDAVGKTLFVNLSKGSVRSKYQTPELAEGWNEVEIPILKDSVTNMAFVIEGDGATTTTGAVYVDDIKFIDVSGKDGGTTPPDGDVATSCSIPPTPGSINGNTDVPSGSSQTYKVSDVTGAESYLWTLPAGWTGTSNSNSITTTVGAESGNISVMAINACGKSNASTLALNVIPKRTNLALNKPAFSSSNSSGSALGQYAVDGNLTTQWTSNSTKEEWIYVDLENLYSVDLVEINWGNEAYAADFKIDGSLDATNWTTLSSVSNNSTLINSQPVSGVLRYIRISTAKSGTANPIAISELAVFGSAATSIDPDAITIDKVVFPNPAKDKVTIRLGEKLQSGNISLYNSSGDLLMSETMKGKHHTFDLRGMVAGLYLIKVSNSTHHLLFKFLKE